MVGSSQTNDLEARFGHILQPIRDLTRNWDVDIAGYLEEYLEDLEKIAITFNNGQTTMNFAEAALLIQGSACVYSKKVEYLYTLVYQVLDMIANKKKQQAQSVADGEGIDPEAHFNKEDKEEFLTLDDTKETKQEKLQSVDDPDKECQVLPRTPANLVAQEEGEKEPNELLNHKGEVLGNLSDFQLNRSKMQPQGGAYLDSNLLPFFHSHLRLLASSTPFPCHKVQLQASEVREPDVCAENRADLPSVDESLHDGGCQAFEPFDNDEEDKEEKVEVVSEQPRQKKVQFAVPKLLVDHWAMLDPYSAGTLCEKEQKVGRTFKLPPCIEQSGTKKRKRKAAAKKLEPISDFVQARVYSHRPKFPRNPAKVPTFPEFDDMFWKEYKRRQECQKQKRKKQTQLEVDGQIDEQPQEEKDSAEEDNWPAQADDQEFPDDHGDGNCEPLHFQGEDNMFGPVMAFGGEFINSLGSSGSVGNSYEELVRQHVENYLASAAKYAQLSELSKRVAEWEEKISPRLQEEEQREQFDIHRYGTIVLEGLPRNQNIPFCQIVGGKPIFQICRLFLATLQLANSYNIELSCPGQLEEAMDRLEIRLLSHKRHYEELADYQAPSLAAKK